MAQRDDALAALIEEAGCSEAWLASRVNSLGTELGLSYDYTAVYRWAQKGQKPRKGVPRLIAAALSERLGRKITPTEFGMCDDGPALPSVVLPTRPIP